MRLLTALFVATTCLFFSCFETCFSVEVRFTYEERMKANQGRFNDPENGDPGIKPDDVSFPIVEYYFGEATFVNHAIERPETRKTFSDGITMPIYLGYLVVDENYRYEFVDKSNGLAPDVSSVVDELNNMAPDAFVYFGHKGESFVPRWSWNGYDKSSWRIGDCIHSSITLTLTTYGKPPDDSYIPRYTKTIHVSLENMPNTPMPNILFDRNDILNKP